MAVLGLGALVLLTLLGVGVAVAVFSSMKGSKPVTWVLAGLLLLVLAAGVAVLLKKPSALELEIVGPPGTAFVGEITVDGTRHEVRGTAPMTYFHPGNRIKFVMIPTHDPDKTELEVKANDIPFKSFYGVWGESSRESWGVSSISVGGMADSAWNEAAVRLLPDATSAPEQPPSDASSPTPQSIDGGN